MIEINIKSDFLNVEKTYRYSNISSLKSKYKNFIDLKKDILSKILLKDDAGETLSNSNIKFNITLNDETIDIITLDEKISLNNFKDDIIYIYLTYEDEDEDYNDIVQSDDILQINSKVKSEDKDKDKEAETISSIGCGGGGASFGFFNLSFISQIAEPISLEGSAVGAVGAVGAVSRGGGMHVKLDDSVNHKRGHVKLNGYKKKKKRYPSISNSTWID